jgi:cytochrome c-type biogenesis protein CcmH/NrfG
MSASTVGGSRTLAQGMTQDLETLMAAIEKTDGYLTLKMWEQAWNILEDLPTHLKNHPDVLIRRIDALTGSEHWTKALILAERTVAVYPQRAEVWLRLARLQAQAGKLEDARLAAKHVVSLDESFRVEVVEDEMLAGIW